MTFLPEFSVGINSDFHVQDILLLLLLFFLPLAHGSVEIWSATVMHIVSLVLIAFWLLPMVYHRRLIFFHTPLDLTLLLFLSSAFISLFTSSYPYASQLFFYKIINYVLIFYLVVNTLREKKRLLFFIWGLVIFGSVYAIIGLLLVSTKFLGFKIFSYNHYNLSFTFVNHNHFAGYLEMVVWLCIGLALAYRGHRRILLFCLGIYITIAIVFSLSRGGILGFTGGLFFLSLLFILTREMKKKFILLTLFTLSVLLIMAILGLNPVIERLETLNDPMITGKSRLEIWKGTIKMIAAHPLKGTGIGTYIYAYPKYKTEYMAEYVVNHAHNDYLELFAENGIAGIVIVMAGIIIFFFTTLKGLFLMHDRVMKTVGFSVLTGCASLLIHTLTDFNFYIPSNAFLFAVFAGLAICISETGYTTSHSTAYRNPMGKSLSRWMQYLFYALLLTMCGYALITVLRPYISMKYSAYAKEIQGEGNHESSLKLLKKAITIDRGNAEILASMGDLMTSLSGKEIDEKKGKVFLLNALAYYKDAITTCPVCAHYYTKKGFCHLKLGEYDTSEEMFKMAATFGPMNAFTHYDLGFIYIKKGDYEQAYTEYKKFLQLKGQYSEMIFRELWEVTPEYTQIKKAIPEKAEIRKKFARFLFTKGEEVYAVEELAYAFSLENSVMNALEHLQGICRRKDYNKALEKGRKYLSQFKDDVFLKKQIALIYKSSGDFEGAKAMYEELISQNPADPALYINFAQLYIDYKKFEASIDILKKGIYTMPYSTELNYNLGICYRKMGKSEEALYALKKAVFMKPDNLIYRYQLGEEYKRNGLYQEAVNEWKKCREKDPNNGVYKRSISEIYKKLGIKE